MNVNLALLDLKWIGSVLLLVDMFVISPAAEWFWAVFPLQAHDRGLHSKGVINCAGYRALTSMEEYLGLLNNSLSGEKWINTIIIK